MTIQTNTEYYEALQKGAEIVKQRWVAEKDIESLKVRQQKQEKPLGTNPIDSILAQRGSNYGVFSEHARIAQNIKSSMADSNNWNKLSLEMKESLEMIAHKLGRILNGNPAYKDSWTDIIGYATLIEKELK